MDMIYVALWLAITAFVLWISFRLGMRLGAYKERLEAEKSIGSVKKDIAEKQRAEIKGRVAEMFAPFLKGFGFSSTDAKFIGDPVDYIVFNGMSEDDIKDVVFVEVKSGFSKLNNRQRQIKDIIKKGKVRWKEVRIEG